MSPKNRAVKLEASFAFVAKVVPRSAFRTAKTFSFVGMRPPRAHRQAQLMIGRRPGRTQ
jgi:hypothetical protein